MSGMENMFASRFLRARKKNRLLSFLSITSVVGVMLGVATLITVVSVMDGFTENLKSKFLGTNPHIIVSNLYGQPIEGWPEYLECVSGVKGVTGAAPLVLGHAMVAVGNEVTGVLVRGVEPYIEGQASKFKDSLIAGSFDDIFNPGNILLGKELALSNGMAVGDEITLISPSMSKGAFGFVPKMKKFRIAGLFDTGIHEHNKTLAYLSLKDSQDFFMMGTKVSAITVYTKNVDKAATIANDVQIALNNAFPGKPRMWTRDWYSMNGMLFAALKLEQVAMFIILTLIIIVASFNIVSMITVTVKDKRREIAILRAMGASESLIRKIFIRQGLFIGFTGTILGNLFALIICYVLKNYEIIHIPKEIYHSSTVPVSMSPWVFALVTLCSVVITYIASMIPARISARMNPLEAIRND